MDPDSLRVFVKVAELQNLTRAGEHLRLRKSTVSRKLKALEAELGGRLLHRSTRAVRLTPDGEALLPRARRMVSDADEIATMFRTGRQLSGQVRVDLPVHFARRFILPTLPGLLERHPGLELFISTTDRIVDPLREGFDCVLRVGTPPNSDLVRRKLGELAMINVVSRAYADARGLPVTLEELDGHVMVHYASSLPFDAPVFEYDEDGQTRTIPMACSVTVNNADAYHAACLAGMGIIQVPRIGMWETLASGIVVELLPSYVCEPMPVTLLNTHGRRAPQRVRAVMQWIADALAPHLAADAARSPARMV